MKTFFSTIGILTLLVNIGTTYAQDTVPYEGCDFVLCQSGDTIYEGSSCNADGSPNDDPCGSFEVEAGVFTDVDTSTSVGRAAIMLSIKGIISGYPDGTFRPDQPVNRAEAAKFLLESRLGSIEETGNKTNLSDVVEGEWYVRYVTTASIMGIISGYPDGTFRPANTVNTAEFLKMLTLTFNLQTGLPYTYDDVSADVWFAQYAGIASAYNLFPERPEGSLMPAKLLTRGEVAVAIAAMLMK